MFTTDLHLDFIRAVLKMRYMLECILDKWNQQQRRDHLVCFCDLALQAYLVVLVFS